MVRPRACRIHAIERRAKQVVQRPQASTAAQPQPNPYPTPLTLHSVLDMPRRLVHRTRVCDHNVLYFCGHGQAESAESCRVLELRGGEGCSDGCRGEGRRRWDVDNNHEANKRQTGPVERQLMF